MDDLVIANLQISGISDADLEASFKAVLLEHKEAVASIKKSMNEADDAYRKYLNPTYVPIEALAKADRAMLNKSEKNIAEKYATLKAAYERPLAKFEGNIREIRGAIKKASGLVDTAVKSYEEAEKAKKQEEIDVYFAGKNFDLVPLARLFNERWLNKGFKPADIRKEIDAKIAEIYGNIKVLERIGEFGPTAKTLYLDTLDMAAAMRQVDTMKANAEKLAREKVEREDRERQAQIDANRRELAREEREAAKDAKVDDLVNQALRIPEEEPSAQPEKPKVYQMTLRFSGTEEKLRALRGWMSNNGIIYEKAAVFGSSDEAALYMRRAGIAGVSETVVFGGAA
jgi:hypothetical protein